MSAERFPNQLVVGFDVHHGPGWIILLLISRSPLYIYIGSYGFFSMIQDSHKVPVTD